MAIVHKNISKQAKSDIVNEAMDSKVYAECSVCDILIVEENTGDGDVYTEMAKECTC